MHAAASVLALGFLLGLRHATDADHILAVSTIDARERRLWAASLVGMLWGLGHTVTVLVVGGAIVWFKLLIPPRIGLGRIPRHLRRLRARPGALPVFCRADLDAGLTEDGPDGRARRHPSSR